MKQQITTLFRKLFSLEFDRASNLEIKNRIISGAMFKGPNMYMLILAIIIASVGLNMNSTATIIGAMLISPLMGCILGISYGIASKDSKLTKKSLIGLTIQVVICIITSTLYFLITPISTTSHELLTRTSPTIWDVLIALAGGFAGIIGLTRKEKSNVIPGVSIATAIMPPLCTIGFGIATMNWKYLLGALYLFFINAFFICVSSIIILKLIKTPQKEDITEKESQKLQRNLIIMAIITVIPSIILAYQTVNDSVLQSKIEKYISTEFNYENTQVVSYELDTEKNLLEIALIGQRLDENEIVKLSNKIKTYELNNINLKITQTEISEGISKQDVESLIQAELEERNSKTVSSTKSSTQETNNLKDKISNVKESDYELVKSEIKQNYPQVEECSITKTDTKTQNTVDNSIDYSSIFVKLKLNSSLSDEMLSEIKIYLKEKLGEQVVITIE